MGKNLLLTTTLILSFGFSTAKAQSYDHYLNQLSNHPSVTQLVQQSLSLEALAKNVSSLPDPQVVVGIDNLPINDPEFDRFLPTSKVIGFRQAIPNPGARSHKSAMQQNKSYQQRVVSEYQLARLKAQFTQKLIELKKVAQLEQLLKEQLDLYQLMETDLRGQLEAGKAIYGRFSEIDVERSEIEQKLNDLRAETVSIQEALIELVGTVPRVKLPSIQVKHWERNNTPLFPTTISQQAVIISNSKIDIAEADFKPSYSVQALYKQRESSQNFSGDDWLSVQASVSIPLWSGSKQTPGLTAAKATKQSKQYAYEQSLRHWNRKMASLRAEQKYALENIELLKRKIVALTEMIAAAQRNYESGNSALEHVLDAQINHLKIAARLISQRSRYQILIVEHNSHIIDKDTDANHEANKGDANATR